MKKKIIIAFLISLFVALAVLSVGIFGVDFEGIYLKILLTITSLTTALFFSINSVTILEKSKNNKFALASLGVFVVALVVMVIMIFSNQESGSPLFGFAISLAAFAVLFSWIISFRIKLGHDQFIVQLLVYLFIGLFNLSVIVWSFGTEIFKDDNVWGKLFWVFAIFSAVGLIVLSIFSKKKNLDKVEKIESKSLVTEEVKEFITTEVKKEILLLKEELKKELLDELKEKKDD